MTDLSYRLLVGLVSLSLLAGCGQSPRSWLKSFQKTSPDWIVLEETRTEDTVEYWIAYLPTHAAETYVRSMAELADHRDNLSQTTPTLPERTYYIFESPYRRHQHTWNIETDEPNYIFRWQAGELETLKSLPNRYRDENNKLMPEGWRPPPPEPEPWYIGAIKMGVGLTVLAVSLCTVALFGRGRKRTELASSSEPTND